MKTQLTLLLLVLTIAGPAAAEPWLLTSDYSTFGRVRGFAPVAPWTPTADLGVVPGDPVGRFHAGKIYVVGRGGANLVQVYATDGGLTLEREFGIGADRNPQDIAFDTAGEAYVSCYDAAVLLRVDVTAGTVLDTYDTGSFADADGLPETAWLAAVGDRLYIACQKLDRNNWYAPTGPGAVLVFDMAAEAWVDMDPLAPGIQPIELTGTNPYTRLEVAAGGAKLRVGCVGQYTLNDGGVEEIDLASGTSLGYLATEQQLGGDITGFTETGDDLHVLVSDPAFNTSLRRFRPADGSLAILDTGDGYVHADLKWDGDFQLYVADRTVGAAGLRVFDTDTGAELTTGPLDTGLPPFQFVMPVVGAVAPVPATAPGGLQLAAPRPNPCNPRAEFRLTGRPGSVVRVGVYDLAGRRVQSRQVTCDGQGRAVFRFTGRDGRGRALAAGVYRVVAQEGTGLAARTVTLLK